MEYIVNGEGYTSPEFFATQPNILTSALMQIDEFRDSDEAQS